MIVNNSQFELGEERRGRGRPFKSRFIEAGTVNYENEGLGQVLVKKETIDKFLNTLVGTPVIIEHKQITDDNVNEERVGVVHNAWFEPTDGWFWCDGIITDKEAMEKIENGISVSCSYEIKSLDNKGGMWHDNPYDAELLDGEFLHLALVPNPRYNDATIVLNSTSREKTMFNLFNRKGAKKMSVNNATDKNALKDSLLEMINKLLKGKGEIDGVSEEDFYKKINEMLDALSYDKDEANNEENPKKDEEKGVENEGEHSDGGDNANEGKKEEEEKKSDSEKESEKDGETSFKTLDNASKKATVQSKSLYCSQAERLALGKKLF